MINAIITAASYGKKLSPITSASKKYKHWISIDDPRRCQPCEDNQGKI